MKILTFTLSKPATKGPAPIPPKPEPRHVMTCGHCCNEQEDGEEFELVVEAGWLHLCEECAKTFWGAFMRAEDAYDSARRDGWD